MSAWQPIETALKNPFELVILAADGVVGEAYWNNRNWVWSYELRDWIDCPTHWMPLPEPPSGLESTNTKD